MTHSPYIYRSTGFKLSPKLVNKNLWPPIPMNGLHNDITGSFPKMSSCCLAPVRAPLRCLFSELPEPPIRPESWPSRGQLLSLFCPSCRWLFLICTFSSWSLLLQPATCWCAPDGFQESPISQEKNVTITSCWLFVVCHPGDQTQAWRMLDKLSTSEIHTQLCHHLLIRAHWLQLFLAVVYMNEHSYRKDGLCLQDHIQHK